MRSGVALALSGLFRRFPFRGKTWLWLRLQSSLAPAQHVIGLPDGGRMLIDTTRYWQRQMLAGCFERRNVWVVPRLLASGDGFIDGGANCGLFSCIAAGVVGPSGRVVAIEADPHLYPQLDKQAELNPMLRIEHAALTKAPGHVTFHVPPEGIPDGWGLGIASIEDRPGWTSVDVRALTIDEIVDDIFNATQRPVAMIKLDLEGHEGPALEGARRSLESGRLESLLVENNDTRGVQELLRYKFNAILDVKEGFAEVDPRNIGDKDTDLLFLRGAAWQRWQQARAWAWLM